MSYNPTLFEYHGPDNAASKDGLFLERLEIFMEKSLSDIKAFAERELRPYEETRRYFAEWHAKYLFSPVSPSYPGTHVSNSPARQSQLHSVLRDASRILETLSTSSCIQSFLLAVDPNDPLDGGFLGGSVIGREFWRGLRGGGETGARAFKAHCTNQLHTKVVRDTKPTLSTERQPSVPPVLKLYHAKSMKNELYEKVRTALRSVSGVRTAEMKWTNPERLDTYGVRLVGWPEGVPAQNPSTLKSGQNRVLLEALQNGTMRFEKICSESSTSDFKESCKDEEERSANKEALEDFSWAYDADAGLSLQTQESDTTATVPTSSSSLIFAPNRSPLSPSSLHEQLPYQHEVWDLDDNAISNGTSYTDYTWGDELHESANSLDVWDGTGEEQSDSERPRKRPRSEEPAAEGTRV